MEMIKYESICLLHGKRKPKNSFVNIFETMFNKYMTFLYYHKVPLLHGRENNLYEIKKDVICLQTFNEFNAERS